MEYKMIKLLGEGGSGKVYLVEDKKKKHFAMKEYQLSGLNDEYLMKLFKSEIEIMNQLSDIKNPNLVALEKIMKTDNRYLVIMEYCSEGTLEDLVRKKKFLPEKYAVEILFQIMNGLKSLHELNIVHRDIKAENILFHENVVKIADFGFAKQNENMMQSMMVKSAVLGTPSYISPELIEDKIGQYSSKVDIWSIAVLFYYMVFGSLPFMYIFEKGQTTGNNYKFAVKSLKDYEKACGKLFLELREQKLAKRISKEAFDFFEKTFQVDPKKRISWAELYDHSLFAKYIEDEDEDEEEMEIPEEFTTNTKKVPKTQKINCMDNKKFYQGLEEKEGKGKAKPPVARKKDDKRSSFSGTGSTSTVSTNVNSTKSMSKTKSSECLHLLSEEEQKKKEKDEYNKKREAFKRTPSVQKLAEYTEKLTLINNTSPEKQLRGLEKDIADVRNRYYYERESICFYQYAINVQINVSKDLAVLNEIKICYVLAKYMFLEFASFLEDFKNKINVYKYPKNDWENFTISPEFLNFNKSSIKKLKELKDFMENVSKVAVQKCSKEEWEVLESSNSLESMRPVFGGLIQQFRKKIYKAYANGKGNKNFLLLNIVLLFCVVRKEYFVFESGVNLQKVKENVYLLSENKLEEEIFKIEKQFKSCLNEFELV